MPDVNGISLFTPTGVFGKDTWLEGAWRQIEDTPGLFFNMVDQTEPERAEGRNTYFKLDIGDSLGQAMVAEHGGDLPEPLDSDWTEGKLRLARLAHTAEVTFDEWEMMNTRPAAAVPVVEMKQTKAVNKMTRELARQTHMDGTGILGTLATPAPSGTGTATATLSATGSPSDRARFRWIAANRTLVDFANPTTGAVPAGGKRLLVRRVNKTANTFVVQKVGGGAVAGVIGDRVTWSGSVDQFSGAGNYASGEFPGLAALMKFNGIYLGIDPTVDPNYDWNPIYQTGAVAGTPEDFSVTRLQKLYIALAESAEDGMQPSPSSGHLLWSDHGVVGHAMTTLVDKIRYMNPAEAGHERADFGFTEVEGLGLRWLTDVHYQPNVLDCLHMSSIKFVRPISPRQGILDFITNGGGEIWLLANAKANLAQGHAAKYRSYLTGLFGMMTYKRNAHGRIDDIKEVA